MHLVCVKAECASWVFSTLHSSNFLTAVVSIEATLLLLALAIFFIFSTHICITCFSDYCQVIGAHRPLTRSESEEESLFNLRGPTAIVRSLTSGFVKPANTEGKPGWVDPHTSNLTLQAHRKCTFLSSFLAQKGMYFQLQPDAVFQIADKKRGEGAGLKCMYI